MWLQSPEHSDSCFVLWRIHDARFKAIRSATILVRKLPWFTVLQLITETTTEHFSNKPAKSAVKWNRKSVKSEGVSHSYLNWHTTEWQISRFKNLSPLRAWRQNSTPSYFWYYMETCSRLLSPHPQFILGNWVLMEAGWFGRCREQNPDCLLRKLNIYLPICSD